MSHPKRPERTTIAGERFDTRDISSGSDFYESVAQADELSVEALEALSAETEAERRARAGGFARMGHGPHVELIKAELRKQFHERVGKFMPGSVDRYPYLTGIIRDPVANSQLAQHGFVTAVPTDQIQPGTKDTVNSILSRVPDGKIIMCCGNSSGWGYMPVEDFRVAVKRNQVRLTAQVLRGGANPASRDAHDGVHLVWFGHAYGLAFRIIDP